MMSFSYLKNNKWQEITREERFFCAVAYQHFQKAPKDTVTWIDSTCGLNLEEEFLSEDWEVGYEVAFYRDYIYSLGINGEHSVGVFKDRFRKRTFDLCLFSEKLIIVIEAKSFEGFDTAQLNEIKQDRKDIPCIIKKAGKVPPKIRVLPLISSKYSPRNDTLNYFDTSTALTWHALFQKFQDKVFARADEVFNL